MSRSGKGREPQQDPIPVASIIELAREMIRIPTQAGIDAPNMLLTHLGEWFLAHGIAGELLEDETGAPCAFLATTPGTGPLFLLDACADTAPAGDPAQWSHAPFAADCEDGWLYGRGAGDSRMGISIFSHLFCELVGAAGPDTGGGRLGVLFDADEHTGGFLGVRRFVDRHPDCAGVLIGYPGNDELVRGARGFYRVTLTFHGTTAHTGQEQGDADNAVMKAIRFSDALGSVWSQVLEDLPEDETFPLGPRMTITGIQGGGAWSVVPDTCTVSIDFRLTPTTTASAVRKILQRVSGQVAAGDVTWDEMESWPPYQVPEDHPLCEAITAAAEEVRGRSLPTSICGPSNIGNFLASRNIPALCGFGVTCEGYHATDERVRLDDIPSVYAVYRKALRHLLSPR